MQGFILLFSFSCHIICLSCTIIIYVKHFAFGAEYIAEGVNSEG